MALRPEVFSRHCDTDSHRVTKFQIQLTDLLTADGLTVTAPTAPITEAIHTESVRLVLIWPQAFLLAG